MGRGQPECMCFLLKGSRVGSPGSRLETLVWGCLLGSGPGAALWKGGEEAGWAEGSRAVLQA